MTRRRNLSILTEVELVKLHHINMSHSTLFLAHHITLEKTSTSIEHFETGRFSILTWKMTWPAATPLFTSILKESAILCQQTTISIAIFK